MFVFWRMPIFPLLQRLTDKSRIKGASPAVFFNGGGILLESGASDECHEIQLDPSFGR